MWDFRAVKIWVPGAGKVIVVERQETGRVPFAGQANATVLKAQAIAEGLTPYAGKQAYIYRHEASGAKKGSYPIKSDQGPQSA
jgi:hypothetical protein